VLEEMGLLVKQKVGKKFVLRSAPDFAERLRSLGQ
jgi:hypothetical protein